MPLLHQGAYLRRQVIIRFMDETDDYFSPLQWKYFYESLIKSG